MTLKRNIMIQRSQCWCCWISSWRRCKLVRHLQQVSFVLKSSQEKIWLPYCQIFFLFAIFLFAIFYWPFYCQVWLWCWAHSEHASRSRWWEDCRGHRREDWGGKNFFLRRIFMQVSRFSPPHQALSPTKYLQNICKNICKIFAKIFLRRNFMQVSRFSPQHQALSPTRTATTCSLRWEEPDPAMELSHSSSRNLSPRFSTCTHFGRYIVHEVPEAKPAILLAWADNSDDLAAIKTAGQV